MVGCRAGRGAPQRGGELGGAHPQPDGPVPSGGGARKTQAGAAWRAHAHVVGDSERVFTQGREGPPSKRARLLVRPLAADVQRLGT